MKTGKLSFLLGLFAVIIFATSCSDYDNGYTEKTIRYERAFYNAFGNIDPKQDWNLVKQLREQGRGTRVAYPNSNMWEDEGYDVPGDITQEEIDKVLAVFNQKGEESYEPLVDWSDFFVQQVWVGTAVHKTANGLDVVGGSSMDWLCAYDPVGKEETIYPEWNNWQATVVTNHDDHVNGFNNQHGSTNDIMLMLNSSTQRFGYKSTTDNGHVFYYFRMEYIDGAYYVGLDFSAEGQNPNEQVQRDYIYNDWIIKIVPAHGETPKKPEPQTKEEIIEAGLLVCEDLGGEVADFDFNDIVLKLEQKRVTTTETNGSVTTNDFFVVTAMAAGGTLPSYVFYKSLKNVDDLKDRYNYNEWTPFGEVDGKNGIHGMMGADGDLTPQNVGDKFEGEGDKWEVEVTDAIDIIRAYTNDDAETQEKIRLYADHYVSYVFDRARIRIYVDAETPTDTVGKTYIEPIYHGIEDDDMSSSFYAANTPQMMLLPLRFEWPTESTFIGLAYPSFYEWVREKELTDWILYKPSDALVTSRDAIEEGEELQPFLRWKDNDDIYLSVTIKEGESVDLSCISLNHNLPVFSIENSETSSPDVVSVVSHPEYIDNDLLNHEFSITLTGRKAGSATVTLTQVANEKYRAESITLNVTVEGNGEEPEKLASDLRWISASSLTMTAGDQAQSVEYSTSSTGLLTVSSSNTGVAEANMGSDNTITVTPKNPGTATITLSQVGDARYKAGNITMTVTVGQKTETEGDGYTEVQVNMIPYNWGEIYSEYIIAPSIWDKIPYDKGVLVKLVFEETPSKSFTLKIENYWSTLIKEIEVKDKEVIFELTGNQIETYLINPNNSGNRINMKISGYSLGLNLKAYIKPIGASVKRRR